MHRFRWPLLCLGLFLAVAPPLSSVLLLMPIIPGAQELDSVPLAYAIHTWRWAFYILGAIGACVGIMLCWRHGRWYGRIMVVCLSLLSIGIHGITLTMMSAEAMFNEPFVVERIPFEPDMMSEASALVVEHNGQVAIYPIDLVGHHHKIMDTVGGMPVMVTYCTMCHTGRVFSPIVNGTPERFRLVGANKYNAMFEDNTTHSWWYQATGACVAGPLKGTVLSDLPFEQVELNTIPDRYAEALRRGSVRIFRPDAATGDRTRWAQGYSLRKGEVADTMTDYTLVLGVVVDGISIAYPVHDLCERPDPTLPVIDTVGRHILTITGTSCRGDGYAVTTSTQHKARTYIDAWHAWQTFHPATKLRRIAH